MGILDIIGGPLIGLAGDLFGADQGRQAANAANAANIKMAREQREWEAQMANTATQRRRKDIEAAGFNPVLAAAGPGAATPSVSPPSIAPAFDPAWTKGSVTQALVARQQIEQMRANTELTTQQARNAKIEADQRHALFHPEQAARLARFDMEHIRKEILLSQKIHSAADAKRARDTTDSLIQMAKQQAAEGKLNLKALENIASMGGIEAGRMQGILKLLSDIILRGANK